MFKKLTSGLKSMVNHAVDFSESALARRYPDIDEVLDVLKAIKIKYEEDAPDAADDDSWRPMILTLGLLYKLQKIQESGEGCWYNSDNIFVRDDGREAQMMHVFGHFWHLMVNIAEVIRGQEEELCEPEQLQASLQARLPQAEVLLANATDDKQIEEHVPDLAVVVLHDLQIVLVNICGTRMIPAPKMSDVLMDLYATAEPFLHGRAHRGMALGAINIMALVEPVVNEALDRNPDYALLVTGYSLGAGICQLVAMQWLQTREKVRCISFGAPLVFEATEEEAANIGDILYTVVCSHDGLASASLWTVTRLLQQIKAVDALQLRRRDMCKLLVTSIKTENGTEMKEEDDSEDDDEFDKDNLAHRPLVILDPDWQRIRDAVAAVPTDDTLAKLTHPARNIFIFKRKGNQVVTRNFTDGALPLAENLRLRAAMFSHHMPWSYNELFNGYGGTVDVADVQSVLNV